MDELIQRLDTVLRLKRAEDYPHLRPGLSDEEVAKFEADLGVTLPLDFKAFYKWRNGQTRDFSYRFADNYDFMPAEEVVRTRNMLNELLEGGEFEGKEDWWNPDWIPFMENGGGDNYCLDLGGSFNGEPGQVVLFYHDEESRYILGDSFYEWLKDIVEQYEDPSFTEF